MSRHVLVIGGGIAGLSAARSLAQRGNRVTVIEREPLLFSHSSGRNAAIYRPLETSAAVTELAQRALSLLPTLGAGPPLLRSCGLTLVAKTAASLIDLVERAKEYDVAHLLHDQKALRQEHPELQGGRDTCGIHLPIGGVLDIHAIAERLRRLALDAGAVLRVSTPVREILQRGGHVDGIALEDGTTVAASDVLVAAGAWSEALLRTCDVHLPLQPYRRHLALLAAPPECPLPSGVAWDIENGAYLRAEGGGLLACPGDHTPSAPCLPTVDGEKLVELARRLPEIAPIYRNSEVKTAWACLRTMSPDDVLVAGPVANRAGLWVFSALAGHGMTVGLAAGELLAAAMVGLPSRLIQKLAPSRFG